jgi:PhnB protein
MDIQPYVFFEGRAEEAIEFYKKTLGAKVEMLMRFKECPDPQPGSIPAGAENKIMHAAVTIGDSTVLMSDGHCSGNAPFQGFSLTIRVANEVEAKKVFDALSAGGQVRMPLAKTFFASSFGMLADKFGMGWMVIADPMKAK